ncbi:trafficking protein particle complex subunit 10 isoform X1 [Rhopalosiphum maidis]|uniref:trafficking protein particle complex subunit 10 isoform X1 n=1 Tax=Rhopalosiphum maidis TaxID=43146 RepID=UPI000F01006F|nr:trafficking protein particle complex subunit 10 isoform X1 [Rhopalosiphum maidis]
MTTANPKGNDALRISDHKPLITYAGDKELFENLKLVLSQSLSQEPIEWRRQYGRPMKMVTLSTDFVPFNKDSVAEQISSRNLVGRPIMHTFWTQCLDMEVYKSLLRDEIDKWMNEMNKHNIIDWVIVVVETYDLRKHNKLLPRTTVFDKIKSDFAEKKADRCLSVINPPKSEVRCGSSAWRALITNVRLLILSAFDRLFLKYEDNIRNYREQRNDPSWSFCKYFLYQEELAFALEMLGIHDEALVQYDELDAMFTQFILNSQVGNVPQWLTEFQVVLEWWSAVLFMENISRKQREAIKIRKLSLLEFRCYLFSRQASLLMAASKPWIVAERALIFLHQAVSDLKTLEIECPQGSVACWVLQCCAQILVICQSVKKPEHLEECSHHTAPLLYYSLKKLYELGDLCGLLPGNVQTTEQLHTVQVLCGGMQSGHDLTTATESVATLKTALSSSETFSKHYLDIAELAISTYKHNKLMRCAHSLVGLELAKFYTLSGDTTKRTMFLVKALKLFEQDNWKLLIVQTNLELVKCFKKIGNVDQFVKTCLQLASASACNLQIRQDHFDQMLNMIQDSNIECIYPMDDVIVLDQIDVKCNNEESNYPSTVSLKFKSNLPKTIVCPKISISVVIGSALKKMKNKLNLVKNTYSYDINKGNILPMTYNHNYQQDGHFASTGITCLNQKSYLRRQDSQRRKPSMNYNKNEFHDIISANNVEIQPGMNIIDLTLNNSKNIESGIYFLDKLSVILQPRLELLTSIPYGLMFALKNVNSTAQLILSDNKCLFAGIEELSTLSLQFGTKSKKIVEKIRLHSTPGLTFCLEDKTEFCSEMYMKSPLSINSSHSVSLPIKLFAQLPPLKDHPRIVHHKLWIKCETSSDDEEMICVSIDFNLPLTVTHRLHTCHYRKFVGINIACHTDWSLALKIPEIICVSPTNSVVELTSMNTTCDQLTYLKNGETIGYLWEINLSTTDIKTLGSFAESLRLNFHTKYSSAEKLDCTQDLSFEFTINNYKTLLLIESGVEMAGKSGEFCRMNTVCTYTAHFKRSEHSETNIPPSEISFKYEIVADKTMWAVCGRGSDVITFLPNSITQSVSVEVMPLMSGYLPIPTLNVFRYFPSNSRQNIESKMEQFSTGQVYDASKGVQTHVLPRITADTS